MKRSRIQRRTPLRPGAGLKATRSLTRSGRIQPKRKPAAEKAKDFAREYGSRARVTFVSKLPCAACAYAGPLRRDNAHTQNDGTGRKGHYTTVIPLCTAGNPMNCHGRQHGPNGGWLKIGMTAESRRRAAAQTEALWLEHRNQFGSDTDDVDNFEDAA